MVKKLDLDAMEQMARKYTSQYCVESRVLELARAVESLVAHARASSSRGVALSDSGWWCEHCQCEVPAKNVTFEETHDIRAGGCGYRVGWRDATARASSSRAEVERDAAQLMFLVERSAQLIACPCEVGPPVMWAVCGEGIRARGWFADQREAIDAAMLAAAEGAQGG